MTQGAGAESRPTEGETVVDRILQREREAPDAVSVVLRASSGDTTISRADLTARSRLWAQRFRSMGLGKGDIIIVMIDHRPDLLFTYIGAMMAGCVPSYMPYSTTKQDPALYRRSHLELFGRIGAKAVVTIDAWVEDHGEAFAGAALTLVSVDQPFDGGATEEDDGAAADAGDIALLQHSSGTTDLKKGVSLSHASILAQADAYAAAIDLDARDVIVSWLPLYHDMGLMACFLLPLVNGVPVVMVDPFLWVRQPQLLFAAIEDFSGTLCWLPNFAYHHLARVCGGGRPYDLSGMRAFIDCSEPCKAATFREFEQTFRSMGVRMGQLQTCYAMAETTYAVTQSRIGETTKSLTVDQVLLSRTGEVRMVAPDAGAAAEFLSVGPAIDGAEIRILNGEGQAAPDGWMGEIALRSTSLFSGYFELPEVTAKAFLDGWYLTGDLGFLLDGELYITGRKKEMFIVRGRNFFAHEIESAVNACEGVKPGRAVAVGVFSDTIGSEEVTVIAESEIEDPAARRRISTAVKLLLDERMGLQVRSVEVVAPGWLIKTTSGKISRKENLAKYQAQRSSGTAAAPHVPGAAG